MLLTPCNLTNYEATGSPRKSEGNTLNSVRDAEVAGSSPATPTIDFRELRNIKLPLFFHWYGFRDGLC